MLPDRMRIAFVGLGAMGRPIADRLHESGQTELILYDADPSKLEAAAGLGRAADSVGAATEGADAVFTVLPADRHVEAVAAEVAEASRPGQLFVDFSTIAPATIERVAARLGESDVGTVSVAVTRGTAAARAGQLGLFIGTSHGLSAQLRRTLAITASELRLVGGLGAAKALKIANNMVLACIDIAICEALVTGSRLGLAPQSLVEHLTEAGAGSWALDHHIIENVLGDDLGPGHFSTRHMAKDIGLFIDLSLRPAFLAGEAAACYRGVIGAGYGEHYHPIVIRWIEDASGRVADAAGAGRPEDRQVLARGVAAVQTLASLNALDALESADIDPTSALEHLQSGSAANESLPRAAEHLRAGGGELDGAELVRDLDAAVERASAAAVPALMLETARHIARGLRG
jgi:3-hydroxyisobutyrate dehydrogenase